MTDGESGVLNAVETPANDYVLWSETQAQEAENQNTESPADTAPSEEAELPNEEADDASESGESSEQPKKLGGYQKKFLKAQAELEQVRAELAKYRQPQTDQKPSEKTTGDKAPDPNDYENVLDYVRADAAYQAKQLLIQEREQASKDAAAQSFQAKVNQVNDALQAEAPEAYQQISELRQAGLINDAIVESIVESPLAKEMAIYFTEQPNDLVALQKMNQVQFYKAMGVIEAGLMARKSQSAGKQEETAERQTKAAAPISPVRTQANTQRSVYNDSLPYDEWVKVRNKK